MVTSSRPRKATAKYEELLAISRDQFEITLAGDEPSEAAHALLRMALNESDQPWAEEKLLSALHDRREEVQAAAITSIGHLARIHRSLKNPVIVRELTKLREDPKLGSLAEDALEDILIFTRLGAVPS